jgi:hypothetical protein
MIYVSAIAKWALNEITNGPMQIPGTFNDFFYETDDEHFFDDYTRSESVFYPNDGAHFFYTHDGFWEYIKTTGSEPWPDTGRLMPVQFMKVLPDGCEEYTIDWISRHFYDFHADWEHMIYRYSPTNEKERRTLWSVNEAVSDFVPERYEILALRNAVAVLLDFVTGKLTEEEKKQLSDAWQKAGDVERIPDYSHQEKRVQEIVKAVLARKASER